MVTLRLSKLVSEELSVWRMGVQLRMLILKLLVLTKISQLHILVNIGDYLHQENTGNLIDFANTLSNQLQPKYNQSKIFLMMELVAIHEDLESIQCSLKRLGTS